LKVETRYLQDGIHGGLVRKNAYPQCGEVSSKSM